MQRRQSSGSRTHAHRMATRPWHTRASWELYRPPPPPLAHFVGCRRRRGRDAEGQKQHVLSRGTTVPLSRSTNNFPPAVAMRRIPSSKGEHACYHPPCSLSRDGIPSPRAPAIENPPAPAEGEGCRHRAYPIVPSPSHCPHRAYSPLLQRGGGGQGALPHQPPLQAPNCPPTVERQTLRASNLRKLPVPPLPPPPPN